MKNTDLTFFTNEENDTIYDRFKATLSKDTQYFDILVAYFRVSGFYRLYKEFENIDKIRILIGINVDNKTYDIYLESKNNSLFKPYKEIKKDISSKLIKEMNYSPNKLNVEKGVEKFIEYLNFGKIEMKVYPKGNLHAKVYIQRFYEEDRDFGNVITGSSNFSESGLKENKEFNVLLKDSKDVRFALDKFENLWSQSIDISDEFVDTLKNDTWYKKDITPYEIYLKVLYEYFKEDLYMNKYLDLFLPEGFIDLNYQRQAVLDAKRKLDTFNGVFLSDVVGLGKTYISAMLAQQLFGHKLIICPPALIDYWEETFNDFGVRRYKVESLGKLDNIIRNDNIEKYKYIFIDESHKFRNEDTQRYEDLHRIAFGKKVILVTATPLNNKIMDIFSQIKLFQIPKSSDIPGLTNLEKYFKELQKELDGIDKESKKYKNKSKQIYNDIRNNVLRYIMIRRTRSEIKNYYSKDMEKRKLSFPNINNPKKIIYEFNKQTEDAFNKTIKIIKKLKYARYKPLIYLKRELTNFEKLSQKNLLGFMKTLLVKRLESSNYAFEHTISRFIESYENFIDMYKKGDVYISKDIDIYDILDSDNDKDINEYIESGEVDHYKKEEFSKNFIDHLEEDKKNLEKVGSIWRNINIDLKLEKFKEKLKKDSILKNNKLIVFTESNETANYLYNNLYKDISNKIIKFSSAKTKFKGKNKSKKVGKNLIRKNYDPNIKNQSDNIRILITTDVLAEGINLHRSNVIINYDLPWNPTRVLQRVGRVNRVGSEAMNIHIFNFFPTDKSEKEIGLEKNIVNKIKAFHSVLGEDAKYLTEQEEVASHGIFSKKLYEKLNDKNYYQEDDGTESELKYLRIIEDVKENNYNLFDKIKKIPLKARTCRKYNTEDDKLITFFKKGKLNSFIISDNKTTQELNFLFAVNLFKCNRNTKRLKEKRHKYYSFLKRNEKKFDSYKYKKESLSRKKGRSNVKYIYKRLNSNELMKNDNINKFEKEFISNVVKALELGILPKRVTKKVKNELEYQANPKKIISMLKRLIPENCINENALSINQKEKQQKVILSEYLKGGKDEEE